MLIASYNLFISSSNPADTRENQVFGQRPSNNPDIINPEISIQVYFGGRRIDQTFKRGAFRNFKNYILVDVWLGPVFVSLHRAF